VHNVGNASRTVNDNNLMNIGLVNLGISKDLFDGFESTAEEVLKFFNMLKKELISIEVWVKACNHD
jgi:hypothetical protein